MCFIISGVTSTKDVKQQISELESLLDSKVVHLLLLEGSIDPGQDTWWLTCKISVFMQIYTTANVSELEEFVPSAKEIRKFYDRPVFSDLKWGNLKAELDNSQMKVIILHNMHITNIAH